jgi:hypothetical protein
MSLGTEIATGLLYGFVHKNKEYKIVIDKAGKVMDIYGECAREEIVIFNWLQSMSDFPECLESIEVKNIEQATNNEDIFLMLCCQTADKKLIVHSHNGWIRDRCLDGKKEISYAGTTIQVIDRNEALYLINSSEKKFVNQITNNINNINNINNNNGEKSIVVDNGSCIVNASTGDQKQKKESIRHWLSIVDTLKKIWSFIRRCLDFLS